MESENKEKIIKIIQQEIELEDDMLGLYSDLLRQSDLISQLSSNDQTLASEILNILLRDTARHKKIMQELIGNL